MKSASEVAADARETVSRLQRKVFSAILTRAQAKKLLYPVLVVKVQSSQMELTELQSEMGWLPRRELRSL